MKQKLNTGMVTDTKNTDSREFVPPKRNQHFISSEITQAWLAQFEIRDQSLAIELLTKFKLVNTDELREGLLSLMSNRLEENNDAVAFYAEREVPINKRTYRVESLFEQLDTIPRRATGEAPRSIKNGEVGSEGIVSQLITEVQRSNPQEALNHPGPDKIRHRKVRTIIVVTDFIGSGRRCRKMLDAFWEVCSVRSWWSYGHVKFEILAFSATKKGRLHVSKHRCKPEINFVIECPTISNCFSAEKQAELLSLFRKYTPKARDPAGYRKAGVLMAFAHGAPNNVPAIFHRRSGKMNKWLPLFPGRVTNQFSKAFVRGDSSEEIKAKLLELRGKKITETEWFLGATDKSRILFLVLMTLNKGPKNENIVSARTGLTVFEVRLYIEIAKTNGWLTEGLRLTFTGRSELDQVMSNIKNKTHSRYTWNDSLYYPDTLRASFEKSS